MTTWHAPPDVLARYARTPEALDEVTAASVEQHLLACAECRSGVAQAAAPVASASWAAIADVIDRPRASIVERLLARFGLPDHLARVIGATPGLRVAWVTTIAVLGLGAAAIARDTGSSAVFLAIAPLLPLGSVLLTFLPAEEPGGEAAAATPLHGAGVAIRRTVAALVPTFLALGLASAALPRLTEAAAWLLPGLALAAGVLLLATYLRPVLAATTLTAGWVGLLTAVRVVEGRHLALVDTVVFEPTGQLVALALAVLAAGLVHLRRDHFSTVEVTW